MKALVVGATGLVGKEILKLLLEDKFFKEVVVLARRSTEMSSPKLTEHLVDFDRPQEWKDKLKGDVLFSSLGTTLKAAGSKEAQHKVDYEYQWRVASSSKLNGFKSMVLISSTGAHPRSSFFYLKTKGEIEVSVQKLGFDKLVILRPGLLEGAREEARTGEKISHFFLKMLPKFRPLARIIPVPASTVARKAVELAKSSPPGLLTLEAQDILF